MPLWNKEITELAPIAMQSYTEIVRNNIQWVSRKILLVLAGNFEVGKPVVV